jgi:hypothetical protein
VLEKVKDQNLSVYAVWMPILMIDSKASVPQATKRFEDARVLQYWDSQAEMSRTYAPILKADGPAWDVYLLFDRNVEWKDQAPVPSFVMDKIGLENGKPLDGAELAKQISVLLTPIQPQR